jgi:hypothetical protein
MAARFAGAGQFASFGVSIADESRVGPLIWGLDSFASLGLVGMVLMGFAMAGSVAGSVFSLVGPGMGVRNAGVDSRGGLGG